MDGPPQHRIIPPRVDTSTSWLSLEEDTAEPWLLTAVAAILGLQPDDVSPHHSFVELGGDEKTARTLRRECMDVGLLVQTEDIIQCRTLAELLVRATPCEPQVPIMDSVASVMLAPVEVHRASRLSISDDIQDSYSRHSSGSSLAGLSLPMTPLEQLMSTQKGVARIATIQSKAGLLEGKLVALLTMANRPPADDEVSDITLIPQSQAFVASMQVASLREIANASLPADILPAVWIVLAHMPLENSGNIDRRRLRTWVQNMNDDIYYQVMNLESYQAPQLPTTEMEKTVQRLATKVLRLSSDQVGMNFSFSQLGGDEMSAMELVARCRHESVFLDANELLGDATLADLTSLASSRGGLAHRWDEEMPDSFDLSPMQQLYFQSSMGADSALRVAPNGNYRFNQSFLLQLQKRFSFHDISAAIEAVVGHHPMLRSRFTCSGGRWSQRIVAPVPESFMLNKHMSIAENDVDDVVERTQAKINIETGPVFVADYFSANGGQQMLYLAAHHLVVDLPSWRIIIHDLDELLQTGSLSSPRSMPFQRWVELQKSTVQGFDPATFLPFTVSPGDYSYWGLEDAPNTYGDAVEVGFSLSAEQTSRLQSTCNRVFRTDSVDIYIAALLLSFARTFKDRPVPAVWNQEHGRDLWDSEVDILETVGWFTTLCPVSQNVESTFDFLDVLRRLKDLRRSIPSRGAPYFASEVYGQAGQDSASREWPFEIIFSYAGSLQHLERDSGVLEQLVIQGGSLASRTSDIGSNVGRIALFEVSAMVDQGSAKIKFFYNRHSKHQERILAWIHNYEVLLIEATERLNSHPQELTLADVPHLDVTYDGLAVFNKERLAGLKLSSVSDIDAIYPVTTVEQSILISQIQRPETCYLHAIYEFASPGGKPVDAGKICEAWQFVTVRHAALRTIFTESVTQNGLYDKIVLRRASPDMLFIDTVSGDEAIEDLNNLPTLRLTDTKPNHRLTVCKTPAKTFIKLDISTALCDSLSIHFLIADLRRAYVTSRAIPDAVHFSFPPYLEFLQAGRQEQNLMFWLDRLRGVRPCLFPRLTMRPEQPNKQRVVNVYHALEVTWRDLFAFARSRRTSVGAILRLAWALLLRSYTGQNRVCFGYQTISRDAPVEGVQHAVGSFASIVPCTYDLAPDTTLDASLQGIEEQPVDSLPRLHYTVEEIQHGLGLKGGQRLYNSCLAFTEEPAALNSKFTTRTNFEIRSVSHQQTFDIDIAMNTRFFDGNLVVDISQRIMAPEQATNVANTFGKAISAILNGSNQPVAVANLFTDRDYAQIVAWDNDSSVIDGSVVHDLVSRMAAAQPDAQAVVSFAGGLSYRELDEAATNLAHLLVDAGVGPHVIVPVVMVKNRLAPVAMLAVLKSGAAFVPIEAEDLSLIQPIFDRLNSHVAIASEPALQVLGNLFERVIHLDDDLVEQLSQRSHHNGSLSSIVTPDDIACVLFTPAASKEIRGYSFSHSALSTAFIGQGPAAKITSESRVMQLSSFSLDIALSEIFTTLIHGGTICIPAPPERLHRHFASAVKRMRVNWTYMTPLMSRKLDPHSMPSLKVVCFRTRDLDEDTYSPWREKVNVILAYGALDVCPLGIAFHEIMGPHQLRCIGRPFSGSMWITNSDGQRLLAPIGAIGELLIQGPTLGRPYPSTEPSPGPMLDVQFGSKKKSRYFKTGHYVRYTEGGLMESVSSKRDNVEIEGEMVDLAEIEGYLRRCLGRGIDVLVDTVSFRSGRSNPILVAFVELGENWLNSDDEVIELKPETKERIYTVKQLVKTGLKNADMPAVIPSLFIPVSELPVTSSLKVDRRRLQRMIHSLVHRYTKEQLVALTEKEPSSAETRDIHLKPLPLTQNEERMRAVWARLLSIDQALIGTTDSFFHAGGDEFLASKLVIACRQAGIPISLGDVLRHASLAELSRAVLTAPDTRENNGSRNGNGSGSITPNANTQASSAKTATPPANEKFATDHFIETVIAPRIGRGRQLIRDVAESSATQIRHIESGMLRGRANIDYFVFRFSGHPVDAKKLKEACQMLVTIHPIMRTAFVPYQCRLYQAVIKSYAVDFERFSTQGWRLQSLEDKIITKDRSRPVTFCNPITKFVLLDAGKQSTLIMRLSKAQYDDLSIALLVKDLKRLYDGTDNPPRRPTYCEFMRCVGVANAQGGEEYWRGLLQGAFMTQVVVHERPYLISNNIKTVREVVPIGSLSNLGISFETVLKASWAMVLAKLSSSSDVLFGELVDGRHVRLSSGQSVAGVMGPTSCAIPVRVRFPDTALSPLALLQQVHTQRISGIRYENYGFLNMVEKCTQWAYWTRFSTLVEHLYEETALDPLEPKSFHLGQTACRFSVNQSKAKDIADLFVQSVMRGASKVELKVSFCASRIPRPFAEQALHLLCESVNMLTSVDIMQPQVPPGFQYRALQKVIPLESPLRATPASRAPLGALANAIAALSDEQAAAIHKVIRAAWVNLLDPEANLPEDKMQDISFYHFWGSLIPAAQLATYLGREIPKLNLPGLDSKLSISMEEIIDNADMQGQFELVVSKMKHSSTTAATTEPTPQLKGKDKVQPETLPAQVQPVPATPTPAAHSQRRKPSMSVAISSIPIGKKIRRIASSVRNAASPAAAISGSSISPSSVTPPPHVGANGTVTPPPPAISVSPAVTADTVSPLTPPSISSPSSIITREAPQLPTLPSFMPIYEEPELELTMELEHEHDLEADRVLLPPDNTARNVGSFGNLSSVAESMTTGSTAVSGDEPDPALMSGGISDSNDYLGDGATVTTPSSTTEPTSRTPPGPGSPGATTSMTTAPLKLTSSGIPPAIRGAGPGEEDTVSPVSVRSATSGVSPSSTTPNTRLPDKPQSSGSNNSNNSGGGGGGGSGGGRATAPRPMSPLVPPQAETSSLRKKRSSIFGRIGLSPIFGSS